MNVEKVRRGAVVYNFQTDIQIKLDSTNAPSFPQWDIRWRDFSRQIASIRLSILRIKSCQLPSVNCCPTNGNVCALCLHSKTPCRTRETISIRFRWKMFEQHIIWVSRNILPTIVQSKVDHFKLNYLAGASVFACYFVIWLLNGSNGISFLGFVHIFAEHCQAEVNQISIILALFAYLTNGMARFSMNYFLGYVRTFPCIFSRPYCYVNTADVWQCLHKSNVDSVWPLPHNICDCILRFILKNWKKKTKNERNARNWIEEFEL